MDPALVPPNTARRLSWADQAETVTLLAEQIPKAKTDEDDPHDDDDELSDRPGEFVVRLGIVQQGYTYRIHEELPGAADGFEVALPLPDGVLGAEVHVDGGAPTLWLDLELNKVGRYNESFIVRQHGAEIPELKVILEATVMSAGDGRASRTKENMELIKMQAPEHSEGAEWKAAQAMSLQLEVNDVADVADEG